MLFELARWLEQATGLSYELANMLVYVVAPASVAVLFVGLFVLGVHLETREDRG